ncbi:hypothetical protein ACOMHN_002026 [Nucella lapillus]
MKGRDTKATVGLTNRRMWNCLTVETSARTSSPSPTPPLTPPPPRLRPLPPSSPPTALHRGTQNKIHVLYPAETNVRQMGIPTGLFLPTPPGLFSQKEVSAAEMFVCEDPSPLPQQPSRSRENGAVPCHVGMKEKDPAPDPCSFPPFIKPLPTTRNAPTTAIFPIFCISSVQARRVFVIKLTCQ